VKLRHVGLAGAVGTLLLSGVSDFDRASATSAQPVAEAAQGPGAQTPKTAPANKDRGDEQDAKGHKDTPRLRKKAPRRHHGGRFDIDETPDSEDEGETALA